MIQESVINDGITFEEITLDYIYRVKRGNQSFVMLDTEIGLNNSSSAKVARSKSGTYDVLNNANIPVIEHVFLLNPNSRFCKIDPYSLADICFYRFHEHIVVKPDNGAQGRHVYKINNNTMLKQKLDLLFSLELSIAISPYYEAGLEYRIVTLNNEPRIFLAKRRTTSWKHNLVEGAVSINVDTDKLPILAEIASRSAKALDLEICSVDILETNQGLFVIEVNDKVMLDEYTKHEQHRREQVSAFYREAILKRFTM
jgi:glutathione synthase/RimK-type ligase-like ATP-grasp enzyme